jgi:hypothetical protein
VTALSLSAAFSVINAVPKNEKEVHDILFRSISKASTDERALLGSGTEAKRMV